MTEWFDQRYISRDEHRKVVDYYRKQVARLYRDVCELRVLTAVQAAANAEGHHEPKADQPPRRFGQGDRRDNVICYDFRRR